MSYEEGSNGRPSSLYASALITPPKDSIERVLPPANPSLHPSSNCISVAPLPPLRYRPEVPPHSPVQASIECDFEPLPYNGNTLERSISPNFWQLVYSPLRDSNNADDTSSVHEEVDSNQIFRKQPSPMKNPPACTSSKDFQGCLDYDVKAQEKFNRPPNENVYPGTHSVYPHHSGWPMLYPPPPYFWYHQYPYGYNHPRAPREDEQTHPRHAYPPLYPKPQPSHFPHHTYHFPAPCDQFGNHLFIADQHPQLEYITEVTVNDVICGRGGAVNNHSGNRRFRQFIHDYKHEYMMESKQTKPSVAMRVIEAVKNSSPPGRFLVKYPMGYLECGDDRAREKASQALREGAAKLRKLVAKKAGGASVASNDDKRKPAPTIPYLDCPKAFEPPRKKVKEEPRSD